MRHYSLDEMYLCLHVRDYRSLYFSISRKFKFEELAGIG